MVKTLSFYDFERGFADVGRTNSFTYEGLKALFDYLESYEEETEIPIELDVIALCCEYTEYENFEELQNDYDVKSIEELEEKTTVIMVNEERFIIQAY